MSRAHAGAVQFSSRSSSRRSSADRPERTYQSPSLLQARATSAMIAGQAQDVAMDRRESATLAECLAMEADKTGALLAQSVAIGAVLGGGSAVRGAPSSWVSRMERNRRRPTMAKALARLQAFVTT